MSLEFRFTLDGTVMSNEPANWEDFDLRLRYSEDVRGVIREYNNQITIYGADYDSIEGLFESNDITAQVTFKIEYRTNYGSYNTLLDAYIVLSQVKLDPLRRIADCTLEDKGFVSGLYQNRTLPIPLNSSTTINGSAITPVTEIQIDYIYDGDLLLGPDTLINAVEYGEALTFVVNYLTDNQVNLSDSWYSSLADYAGVSPQYYGISYNSSTPTPTLQALFSTIAKLYNLYFTVNQNGSTLTFTISEYNSFYSSTVGATISNPENLSIRLIPERVVTSVTVGDSSTNLNYVKSSFDISDPIDLVSKYAFDGLYGFSPTEYPITTVIGGGATLDLQTEYGYSLGHYATSQSQGKYVMCQYTDDESTETGRRIIMQPLSFVSCQYTSVTISPEPGALVYQKREIHAFENGPSSVENAKILARYDFLEDINWPPESQTEKMIEPRLLSSTSYNETNVTFETYFNVPLYLDRDASSYNLTWDNNQSLFTVTDTADGYSLYQIDYRYKWEWTLDLSKESFQVWLMILVNDGGTTYQMSLDRVDVSGSTGDNGTDSGTFYLQVPNNGTTVSMACAFSNPSDGGLGYDFTFSFIYDGATPTYMDITRLHTTSELIAEASPNTVKMYGVEIDTPMELVDYLAIFNDPTKRIDITNLDQTHQGWAYNLGYNLAEGRVTGEIITDFTNLYAV